MTSDRSRDDRVRGLRRLIPHAPVLSDEEMNREARLAYISAWVMFVLSLSYGLARLFSRGEPGDLPFEGLLALAHIVLPMGVAGINVLCMALLHRGSVPAASGMLVGVSWLALVLLSIGFGGSNAVMSAGMVIIVVLAGLLLGGPASIFVVVISVIAGWAMADAERAGLLASEPVEPMGILVSYAMLFSMAAALIGATNKGFRQLLTRVYGTEREMRAQNWELRGMRGSLELRVKERTEELNRRSGYLEAAARVAYAAGEILDVEDLLRESVDLIRDAFGLYYVGLFLVAPGTEADSASEGRPWAILRAGTGEAGRKMLARGHRIRVGDGMVGWSIEQGQSRFAQHALQDNVRLRVSELPETRAEAALPLRARGRVVGALTVQSAQADFFDVDTVNVLQTMADLTAVALSNAELFQESEMAMEALRRAYGEISAGAWEELLRHRKDWGYLYAEGIVQPIQPTQRRDGSERDWMRIEGRTPAAGRTPAEGRTLAGERDAQSPIESSGGTEVVVPMRIGETVIGAIQFRRRADGTVWDDDDLLLLNALTEQLVQALDSARLLQETQRQAAREQQVSEIAGKLANTVDVDTMLRTAVQELGRLPGVLEASVHLATVKSTNSLEGKGGNGGNGDHG
jgi:GAF domain-containing protein